MAGKTVRLWLIVSGLCLSGAVCLRLVDGSQTLALALAVAGLAIFAWVGAALAHPWLGGRSCYRVRYDSAGESHRSDALLGALSSVAQTGAISIVWQRRSGKLTLFMEVPSDSTELFEGLLPRLLPEAILEPVAAPPTLPAVSGVYHWPLQTVSSNEAANPLAFEYLASEEVFIGDLELRVNLVPHGANIVVNGTAGPEAAAVGVHPLWRHLWRLLASDKGQRLLKCLPLWEAPPESSSSGTDGRIPRGYMSFPATDIPGTSGLDSRRCSVLPLPDSYASEGGTPLITLGRASAGGQHVVAPLGGRDGLASSLWKGHFLVAGGTAPERDTTISMLADQVVNLGGSLVLIDALGDRARRIAAQLSPFDRARKCWIDIDNPAGSLRLNMLAVSPVISADGEASSGADPATRSGRRTATWEAGEAAALVIALSDCVPLLGEYISQLGVGMWASRSAVATSTGSNLLLDWARLTLIAHHRTRLLATEEHLRATPAPDIRTLYELLPESEKLPSLVEGEATEWVQGRGALADRLGAAGEKGAMLADLVRQTLGDIEERINAVSAAELRLLAAGLRDQLRPAMHHPSLSRLWRGPFEAPATVLDRTPGPLLLARLPSIGVAAKDAGAARWYGSYIVSCVVAAAMWRIRAGRGTPPVLVVLDRLDEGQHAQDCLYVQTLRRHFDLLGRAGVAVLASSAGLGGSQAGECLLDDAATWWIHRLSGHERESAQKRLARLGVPQDFSLQNLPEGIALLKVPAASESTVATVYTGGIRTQPEVGEKPKRLESVAR